MFPHPNYRGWQASVRMVYCPLILIEVHGTDSYRGEMSFTNDYCYNQINSMSCISHFHCIAKIQKTSLPYICIWSFAEYLIYIRMLLSLISIISYICILAHLEPVLSFPSPESGNATNLAIRDDEEPAPRGPPPGRPQIRNNGISDTQREQIQTGIDDAIHIVDAVLGAYRNEKVIFMHVYDKYFPRQSKWKFWKWGDPRSHVMGWS